MARHRWFQSIALLLTFKGITNRKYGLFGIKVLWTILLFFVHLLAILGPWININLVILARSAVNFVSRISAHKLLPICCPSKTFLGLPVGKSQFNILVLGQKNNDIDWVASWVSRPRKICIKQTNVWNVRQNLRFATTRMLSSYSSVSCCGSSPKSTWKAPRPCCWRCFRLKYCRFG